MVHGGDETRGGVEAGSKPSESLLAPLHAATLAAGLLEEAWSDDLADGLRAGVIQELADGLRQEIEALAGLAGGDSPADALADGALRAADVANLAASSLAELPAGTAEAEGVAAAHLAAGAARALCALAEVSCAGTLEGEHADHALRDIRSARWRAGFADRQVEEYAGPES